MKANSTFGPFQLGGTAMHMSPDGVTTVLRGGDLQSRLPGLPGGLLLAAFEVAHDADVHPQTWEMHPTGDEILVMLTGALCVEWADESRRHTALLTAGQGIVMPGGAWHRLELREPGVLLTLTPLQGTRHSGQPEGRP